MIKLLKRWRKSQNGTAAIEMGLLFPVFILTLIPPMEYARFSHAERVLTDAANQAASYAALTINQANVSETDVRNYFIQKAGSQAPSLEEISISYSPDTSSGSRVTVGVDLEFTTFSQVFGTFALETSGTRTIF